MDIIEIKNTINDIKENILKEITRLEELENLLYTKKYTYKVKINGKLFKVNTAIDILVKLAEQIGYIKIYNSKFSYRTTTINKLKITCPAVINKKSDNFEHLISANNGSLYKKVDDGYYLCSNMSAETIIKNAVRLAAQFNMQFKIVETIN